MIKKIDARNDNCPIPVIKAKAMIEETQSGIVSIDVADEITVQNVLKMVDRKGLSHEVKENDGYFTIDISVDGEVQVSCTNENDNLEDCTVFITSNMLGGGADKLGEKLISGFIFALTQVDSLPKHIIFMNSGVELTSINENTIKDLKQLESCGVTILSCGLCLDFYNLKEKLQVGTVSNMYEITEILMSSAKVLRP